VELSTEIVQHGTRRRIAGRGNGPIDAVVGALTTLTGETIRVIDYHEHAIGEGADAAAVTYIELRVGEGERARTLFGVGRDRNIVTASLKAILSALNRVARATQPASAAA
jgi:2-isopropylmalate synthase